MNRAFCLIFGGIWNSGPGQGIATPVWYGPPSACGGSNPVPLREALTTCRNLSQDLLNFSLADIPGPLSENHQRLVAVPVLASPEQFVRSNGLFSPCRSQRSRIAPARFSIAKAVYNLPATRSHIDRTWRRLCDRETVWNISSQATILRAFAKPGVRSRIHEARIVVACADTKWRLEQASCHSDQGS